MPQESVHFFWEDASQEHLTQCDWRSTALGHPQEWPPALVEAARLVFSLSIPAAVLWGEQLLTVPNAPFAALEAGVAGRSALTDWPRGWPGGASAWATVRRGETTALEAKTGAPALSLSPVRDETGAIVGVLALSAAPLHDRAFETQLSELQHQARNALAWARSIAKRTAATSVDLDDFAMHFDGRIDALSRVRIAAAVQRGGVPLDSLVASELLAVDAQEDGRLVIEGPEIMLPIRVAETFGLAIHELSVNAVKFGALAVPEGRIAVTWRIEPNGGGGFMTFHWEESGVSGVADTGRQGFGREVIERTLPYELGAVTTFNVETNGLRCIIEVPLERLAEVP